MVNKLEFSVGKKREMSSVDVEKLKNLDKKAKLLQEEIAKLEKELREVNKEKREIMDELNI